MVSDFFSRVKKKFESFCSVNKFLEIPPNFPQMPFIYPKIPLHFLSRKKNCEKCSINFLARKQKEMPMCVQWGQTRGNNFSSKMHVQSI